MDTDRLIWKEISTEFKDSKAGVKSFLILSFDILFSIFLVVSHLNEKSIYLKFLYSVFLCLLYHLPISSEATHNALSKQKWLNEFLGHLFSVIICLPHLLEKISHVSSRAHRTSRKRSCK